MSIGTIAVCWRAGLHVEIKERVETKGAGREEQDTEEWNEGKEWWGRMRKDGVERIEERQDREKGLRGRRWGEEGLGKAMIGKGEEGKDWGAGKWGRKELRERKDRGEKRLEKDWGEGEDWGREQGTKKKKRINKQTNSTCTGRSTQISERKTKCKC